MNIPACARNIDLIDCSVAWILLTFLGVFGIQRFHLGKWATGILYLVTLGLFGISLI